MRKVFGIGYGRTGTTSVGHALKELGYRHCGWDHGLVKAYGRGDFSRLRKAIDERDSFEDFPWPHLYEWLDREYPDSLFVLTVRDSTERWYQSLCRHIEAGWGTEEGTRINYGLRHRTDILENRDYLCERYERHNADVRDYFRDRPEKLLVACWERGDGWQELCRFVGSPVPASEFPHVNKAPTKLSLVHRWATKHVPHFWRLERLAKSAFGERTPVN